MTQGYRVWLAMQLSATEAEEFRVLVRNARELGWKDPELGQRIGFQKNPGRMLDQVMKRRKSALGEHLKALREVVSTREEPPAVNRPDPAAHGGRPPAKPAWAYAVPASADEAPHEKGETPDLSAPLPDTLTDDEALEFCSLVEDLNGRGWTNVAIGKELGYKNPNGVSAAVYNILNDKGRPRRDKLTALRNVAASRRRPPAGAVRRRAAVPVPVKPAPAPRPAPAAAAPAPPPPAPAPAPRAEPPVPVERIPDAARVTVRPRPVQPGDLTVLDHLQRAESALERVKAALADAEKEAGNACAKANRYIRRGLQEDALSLFPALREGLDKLTAALSLE